ncbi:hypothetical protein ALC57_12171, partial [Trachymyrmex cornetzi]
IAVQFAVTVMVVCSNLYRMAMATEHMKFVPLIVYTGCMLTQIFIYCWFGNEVKLKVYIFHLKQINFIIKHK